MTHYEAAMRFIEARKLAKAREGRAGYVFNVLSPSTLPFPGLTAPVADLAPVDFTAPDCPMFAFDDSLAISTADVRRIIEEIAHYGA